MDSTADISGFGARLRPYLAIAQYDLRSLWQSKLVRLWLAASVVVTLLLTLGNWTQLSNAPLIAFIMFPYLVFPWFLVVIALGVTPVSGLQAETLADGVLSRPVTRHGFLLATWISRVVTTLGVFFVVAIPAVALIALADRPTPEDKVTLFGIMTSLGVVGLVLTLLVSLGFFMGTLLRKPLLAVTVLIFVWYPINLILSVFSLEQFSPISLNQALTTQLRRPWRQAEVSQESTIEQADAEAFSRQASHFLDVLSGKRIQMQKSKPDFFEPGKFEDFSLAQVALGYSVPTLIAVGLAVLCFHRRDL
jgi:ABC-type transport system involved in multi-copper enzyme maturation permease subunit